MAITVVNPVGGSSAGANLFIQNAMQKSAQKHERWMDANLNPIEQASRQKLIAGAELDKAQTRVAQANAAWLESPEYRTAQIRKATGEATSKILTSIKGQIDMATDPVTKDALTKQWWQVSTLSQGATPEQALAASESQVHNMYQQATEDKETISASLTDLLSLYQVAGDEGAQPGGVSSDVRRLGTQSIQRIGAGLELQIDPKTGKNADPMEVEAFKFLAATADSDSGSLLKEKVIFHDTWRWGDEKSSTIENLWASGRLRSVLANPESGAKVMEAIYGSGNPNAMGFAQIINKHMSKARPRGALAPAQAPISGATNAPRNTKPAAAPSVDAFDQDLSQYLGG
jgi:hypothetical protein